MAEAEKEKEGEGAPAATPPAKKSKLPLIIGGVVVLILLIGAPVLYLTLSKKEEPAINETISGDVVKGSELKSEYEGALEEEELEEGESPLGAIVPLETFVVNLDGGRYIRAQIQLEFTTRDVSKRFYARVIPIRDAIISALSKKSAETIVTDGGRQSLKTELKSVVNEALGKDEVAKVYFSQFLVQ
jgi:flagellar basal body-associated protein FliL